MIGSIFLLLGTEYPKTRKLFIMALGLAALLSSLWAFWLLARTTSGSFSEIIMASLTLSNFAIALQRFK